MKSIRVIQTTDGIFVELDDRVVRTDLDSIDPVFTMSDPARELESLANSSAKAVDRVSGQPLPPLGSQEIWAAGVTYETSRSEREKESSAGGGSEFYRRVYDAARPEIFYKGNKRTTVGDRALIRVRADSNWTVPEPELGVAVSAAGRVFGYVVANDVSSRDIEGENPLYLPQAKIYRESCAIGPALVVCSEPPTGDTKISLTIARAGLDVFSGTTELSRLRRPVDELVRYLVADNDFPTGAYLLTGTGIVPAGEFTLETGDIVTVRIDGIGVLTNTVA